jgi:hypothetical protein
MAKRKRRLCAWPCCPENRTNLGQPRYVSVQLGRFPRITTAQSGHSVVRPRRPRPRPETGTGAVVVRERLGGLLNHYHRAA